MFIYEIFLNFYTYLRSQQNHQNTIITNENMSSEELQKNKRLLMVRFVSILTFLHQERTLSRMISPKKNRFAKKDTINPVNILRDGTHKPINDHSEGEKKIIENE